MSHAGLLGNAGQPNYASAKLGIGALTMVWAREMAKYNVTANAIVPMARTRMTTQTTALGWLSVRGGKLELWLPPQLAKSIDIERKWTVKEISERINELGSLGMPGAEI